MSEGILAHCKAALSNLFVSEQVELASDPLMAISEDILNFVSHYCLNDHTSEWCHHEKVSKKMNIMISVSSRLEFKQGG